MALVTDLHADRLAGTLLGTALGDALGLPCEGMSARSIERRFGRVERFYLLGHTGFVSDDTEQAALVAQSLIRHPDDPLACQRAFSRSILGWFCRLPWGIGLGTLRACLRIGAGISPSGGKSAGNGAAMRAPIIGSFFYDQPEERQAFGRPLAEVTHRDPRAVEGALYVAEIAALCCRCSSVEELKTQLPEARLVVRDPELGSAIDRAISLADQDVSTSEAARTCGTSGYVVHTVAFATCCLLRHGDRPMQALRESISAGGDTDSIGAILGAWSGALHGEAKLSQQLVGQLHDGPFGPSHLRALASGLAARRAGVSRPAPGYSVIAALFRNLTLYPVILAHGFRRILPF